ncbi:excreted virulence factor EspC (type VII ESX diderm) [Herbihabitans rhizosphaerae]|uniref:Excreted virulence factor EspC (Type VII ESX diderm) n=1 Tax=Herbihabitans rhizosphaerae TaxID=1872711 RepID=A0A4Q7KHM9_9PSEU|nr:type VII secretion target [Herbihabitans rhizosphaerae]RZS34054.1 excreted virulence factor EspC (type VII ESX diderm) [Herbihabitans rhizosphaerae]
MGNIDVDPAALRRAAGAAKGLGQKLSTDGRIVDNPNNQAAGALSAQSYQLGKALKNAADTWYQQVSTLSEGCAKLEQGLRGCADDHQRIDGRVAQRLNQIAKGFS